MVILGALRTFPARLQEMPQRVCASWLNGIYSSARYKMQRTQRDAWAMQIAVTGFMERSINLGSGARHTSDVDGSVGGPAPTDHARDRLP